MDISSLEPYCSVIKSNPV